MVSRDRLPPWHERHRLPNGRDVLIRPIRPEDADPLRAGFGLLEPAALRARLAPDPLVEADAERLSRLNPKTEFALVVADPQPPGEAVVAALGHIRTDARGRQGEFTVLVSRFIAGMGMGRYLLTRLVKWARSRRLDVLQGELQADRPEVLDLARTLGFQQVDGASAPGLVRVSLDIAGA